MAAQKSKKSNLPQLNERKISSSEEPTGFNGDRDADKAGAGDELYGMIFHAYDGKVTNYVRLGNPVAYHTLLLPMARMRRLAFCCLD